MAASALRADSTLSPTLLVRDKDKEDLTTFILHTVALVLYVSQLRVLTIPVAAQGIPK